MSNDKNPVTDTNTLSGKGLPPELITKLMSESRTAAYGPRLLEFVESDEAGINPREAWPVEFKGKTATAIYQSFKGAVKKASLQDMITVIKREDDVFLMHNERVAAIHAEAAAE